ncbi:MAG: hypothetical protein AWU59_2436 [Methanolobus sp. T82-4]|nr:MAG: hypothetical protein AWU59_2436 [Methanolobus sp. T82-4]
MYESIRQNPDIWSKFIGKDEDLMMHSSVDSFFDYDRCQLSDVLSPEVSRSLIDSGFEVVLPEEKKFAVCLTHDVDDIYPPLPHTLLSVLHSVKGANLGQLKKHALWRLNGKNSSPYLNFREIMDIEESYGAKSSFYFLTAEKDPRRFRYNIEDAESYMGEIVDRGCEVGLHGGYFSYASYDKLAEEKQKLENVLGKKVIGFRNHYLRFKMTDSWEILSKAGFRYDSTLGFNNAVGFRNGLCHPFRPFDVGGSKELDILEIPLVAMDAALFNCTASFKDAWELIKGILDTGEQYNGIITLLWHNSSFSTPFRKDWKNLYIKILDYCNQKNAWITSGEDIYRWWNNTYINYP